MNIQDMIDALSYKWALERSQSMKTLGELVCDLSSIEDKSKFIWIQLPDKSEVTPTSLSSYRGYYSDLAIEYDFSDAPITVEEFSNWLKDAIGKEFTGYKGGEFMMNKITPVWVSNYGSSSEIGIIEVTPDGAGYLIKTEHMEEE